MNVEGKPALVTGAASGLGEATARLLAARGAKVTIIDFNDEGAQRVAEEIGGLAVKCDVANAESGEAAVAKSIDTFGLPRILVNCAGVAPAQKILSKSGVMPLADYRAGLGAYWAGSVLFLFFFLARAG